MPVLRAPGGPTRDAAADFFLVISLNFSFARSEIGIASPTARRLRASTSTSASTSPASSSSPTLRHGEMAGTLGGARLRRHLHRRLVRTSTFTDWDVFTDFAHRRLTSRYSV